MNQKEKLIRLYDRKIREEFDLLVRDVKQYLKRTDSELAASKAQTVAMQARLIANIMDSVERTWLE